MNIARILYPVKVLGPGDRVGIWLCGCKRECHLCSNPELWKPQPKYELTLPNIKKLIDNIANKNKITGFTITGGEPMEQAEELSELLTFLALISKDIIIYSGYTLYELQQNPSNDIKNILSTIAVLIDGEYIEERNNDVILRGSDNQRINVLNPNFKNIYDEYLKTAHNQIQNFTTTDGVVSVGIHKKRFLEEIDNKLNQSTNGGNDD
jgi:anaerobic ribonucleoside-triphosphate reductase activating protein